MTDSPPRGEVHSGVVVASLAGARWSESNRGRGAGIGAHLSRAYCSAADTWNEGRVRSAFHRFSPRLGLDMEEPPARLRSHHTPSRDEDCCFRIPVLSSVPGNGSFQPSATASVLPSAEVLGLIPKDGSEVVCGPQYIAAQFRKWPWPESNLP